MSLQMESPLTDSKMDISDTTTSQGSAGISPLGEDDEQLAAQSPMHNNHTVTVHQAIIKESNLISNSTIKEQDPVSLDNRFVRPHALPLELTPQRQNIERTLADSHPLMSPTGSENDQSSASSNTTNNDLKRHNFPDVVPHYEHLQQPPIQPSTIVERNTMNSIRGAALATAPAHNKLSYLRTHSPDLLSSESEADISQYHAAVEPNFQTVALIPTNINNDTQKHVRRVGKSTKTRAADDISSLDSISNHSFDDDEDIEHNLASLSPSSSLIDGLDDDESDDGDDHGDMGCIDDDEDFPEAVTPTPQTPHSLALKGNIETESGQLPQYSAAEERRDSRNWQKITLPDGRTREIDMRVIEPYKRVLSHGGYLQAGCHNAIVIFCACHLPDRSRADYSYVMDNLFLYVVKTLEQLVTEDYVLIYLHGGTSRRNVPPFPWLKKCYQLLDRRLRKSLKNMYLVHPTFWIKSIVWMTRPFVSAKFWRKLIYVKSLDELAKYVVVEKAAIPEKVKQYDARHN